MPKKESKITNYQDCILVTHASELHGPPYALVDYLLPRTDKLLVLKFPITADDEVKPSYQVYVSGRLVDGKKSNLMLKPFILNYIKDMILYTWWALKMKRKYKMNVNVIFACNNLLAAWSRIIRRVLRPKTIVFYAIDYANKRFTNKQLNRLYLAIDRFAARNSTVVWSNTNRTRKIRERQGVRSERNLLVPNGSYVTKAMISDHKIDKDSVRMIIHSYLSVTKGIQNVIMALNKLTNENFILDIYGYGPYEQELQKFIDAGEHKTRIKLCGKIDHYSLLEQISWYDIDIAMYNTRENYAYFADPMKIKDALACEVPVITTDVSEVAEMIENNKLGIVVDDSEDIDLIAATLNHVLSNPETLQQFRKNIKRFKSELDWDYIYDKALQS